MTIYYVVTINNDSGLTTIHPPFYAWKNDALKQMGKMKRASVINGTEDVFTYRVKEAEVIPYSTR